MTQGEPFTQQHRPPLPFFFRFFVPLPTTVSFVPLVIPSDRQQSKARRPASPAASVYQIGSRGGALWRLRRLRRLRFKQTRLRLCFHGRAVVPQTPGAQPGSASTSLYQNLLFLECFHTYKTYDLNAVHKECKKRCSFFHFAAYKNCLLFLVTFW